MLKKDDLRERMFSPNPNSIVEDHKGNLIVIINGQYNGLNGVSNFWYWRKIKKDLTLGKEQCGYGNFFKYDGNLKVKLVIQIIE